MRWDRDGLHLNDILGVFILSAALDVNYIGGQEALRRFFSSLVIYSIFLPFGPTWVLLAFLVWLLRYPPLRRRVLWFALSCFWSGFGLLQLRCGQLRGCLVVVAVINREEEDVDGWMNGWMEAVAADTRREIPYA
jgi:hypothetical protein